MLPEALSQLIFVHTSVKVCAIIEVEVITVDQTKHMICCFQTVSPQVRAFLNNYGGGSVMLQLVLCLEITGYHIIVILLSPPPPHTQWGALFLPP